MENCSAPSRQGLYDPNRESGSCGVGFIAQINGEASNITIRQALELLRNLEHRGAEGADGKSGDGAGILCQIPHLFLKSKLEPLGIELSGPETYGVGMIFLPREDLARRMVRKIVEKVVADAGLNFLGWRLVPVDGDAIGTLAQSSQPRIRQFFVQHPHGPGKSEAFERQLYLLRRRMEALIRQAHIHPSQYSYILSFSSKTIIYKGMLRPSQLDKFYLDLQDPLFSSALALVHSRFSTNTFPSWSLAQPFRHLCHNGEINTIRGNRHWMKTREGQFSRALEREGLSQIPPLLPANESDSSSLDRCLELLYQNGRSLAHSSLMLIPDPWESRPDLSAREYDFYRYHSMIMEPWDGPAAICFTNGRQIGAKIDRNGLRPLRYLVTKDGRVILASEAGAVQIEESSISHKGRIAPGQILLVDLEKQKILNDRQLRSHLSQEHPYGHWLQQCATKLVDIPKKRNTSWMKDHELLHVQKNFGYTREEMQYLLLPMAREGKEQTSSMGNDSPLAVLSNRSQLLFNYFRQLFAQVTNPPIDPIRERQVMSLTSWLGPQPPLLKTDVSDGMQVECRSPILSQDELKSLMEWKHPKWKVKKLSLLLPSQGRTSLKKALSNLKAEVDAIIDESTACCLLLSDREVDAKNLAIPSLLALSSIHQHLIRRRSRSQIDLIIETGEARSVHHMACLLGYGASAVSPYLAEESLCRELKLTPVSHEWREAWANYRQALELGLLKIFSKMGISTAQSYRGAQLFEIIGISQSLVAKHFTGTTSQLGGLGLKEIEHETRLRHQSAYFPESIGSPSLNSTHRLPPGNDLHFRPHGEKHSWRPEVIERLQNAVRTNNSRTYQEFSRLLNENSESATNLRDLLEFRWAPAPIPLDKIQSAASIVQNFTTGAMSLGALSEEAHQSLAKAMNRLGAKSNSGEGGEDPRRYRPLKFQTRDLDNQNEESLNSAIKQVASGRFGVTASYLRSAREIQIKMAQGAKPGEGGQLPGHKVDENIARLRHSTPGVPLISPPPHHDIYSIEDLKQLIFDLRNIQPEAAISVKLVSQKGVGTVATGVAKAHADKILISGDCGGTGAAPVSSIKHAGSPWELGLAETHQTLILNGLRERVRLETDGQIRTGRDVAIACLLGADEFGFSTAPLVTQGCLMMRKCHLNTCPVGIATQDPILRQRFQGLPEYLIRYFFFVAEELRQIMAKMGFRSLKEMRGRVDRLDWNRKNSHWKAQTLDLSPLLYQAQAQHSSFQPISTYREPLQSPSSQGLKPFQKGLLSKNILDRKLLELSREALKTDQSISVQLSIRNTDLCVGTFLSGHLLEMYGEHGLTEDRLRFFFKGSAGQSLGAFAIQGISLRVEGEANDYAGKGLSGGKIILVPPRDSQFKASDSIIVGNTCLYGATSGEFYAHGLAGERFAVRNSGALAVVEGLGDHGCEYMTGGIVVILGKVGRNFAAGMSGGQAFIWDRNQSVKKNLNPEMVHASPLQTQAQEETLRHWIEKHHLYTGSPRAYQILENWDDNLEYFVAVSWRGSKQASRSQKYHNQIEDIRSQVIGSASEMEVPGGQ